MKDYINYILEKVEKSDTFKEAYIHKGKNYETFYLIVPRITLKYEKKIGEFEWEIAKRFGKISLSIKNIPQSRKDDLIPDNAKSIEVDKCGM